MACTSDIVISQDNNLEHKEMFLLLLESSDQSVMLDSTASQLTIEIRDTNSEKMKLAILQS